MYFEERLSAGAYLVLSSDPLLEAVVAQQENLEGRYHSMIQEARQTLSKYTSLTVEKEVLERNNLTSWEAVVAQQDNWEGRYHSMIQEARQTLSKYISLTVEKEVLERNNLTSWKVTKAVMQAQEGSKLIHGGLKSFTAHFEKQSKPKE